MRIYALVLAFTLVFAPMVAQAKILDIQELKTPNGTTVWLVEDHTLPVISLSFAFRAGVEGNPPEKQGLAQLLSNTLDEGAGNIPSQEFQGTLRDRAISLAFDTSRDEFSGDVRTLVRHKDKAFELLKLALAKPRFDAEPVERMRKANLSRIRSNLGDADWIASRILYSRIYAGHPYGLNSGGTLESMQKLTAGDLRAEWKRLAGRDRLVVGITGDITRDEAVKLVDDVFAGVPEKAAPQKIEKAPMPVAGKPVFYAKDMPQTILTMAWDGLSVHDPDYYASVVMDYIFGGGGFTSRLMAEVREKRGLTYGISSGAMHNDYADRYTVSGSMQPQNVAETLKLVKEIAANMGKQDVSADELKAAKEYLVGSLPLTFSSTLRIAGTLVNLQLNNRPATALDDYRAKIEAVTPADIRRVAARIFAAEPVVVMVGA
ncbi:MAG: insulinase family protein, partial [Alphaproteobacteria bacterium]|nr:insulinase family protein [Alphaproteobacteria bacterium]